jgi:Zn-dependent protease/CBS domain-containing protein
MKETVRLGEISGIRVGINWSVIVIFLLVLVGLSGGYFPVEFPDRPAGLYALAGLVSAVLFFASLLAHEMAHALVARRNGIEVEGITLWLFGGVARLSGEARDPGAELRISGVGPLVSVLAGVLFFALAILAASVGVEGLPVGVLSWLALINVVLAVFNLVPAAPLDGGRILRAILWKRHGDRLRAAITATRAGRAFGFVLIALGLWLFLVVPGFFGVWWMLIGWFIINAAGAEEQHARLQASLSGVRVRDVMSPDPLSVPGDLSIDRFLEDYVLRNRFSTFPLVENGGRPVGLVTLNRVKQVPRDDRGTTSVRSVACGMDDLAVAAPDDMLVDLLPRLGQCADGRALVLDEGRVIGIVSPTDIMRTLELAELRDELASRHV